MLETGDFAKHRHAHGEKNELHADRLRVKEEDAGKGHGVFACHEWEITRILVEVNSDLQEIW